MTQRQFDTFRAYDSLIYKINELLEEVRKINNQCEGGSSQVYLMDEVNIMKQDVIDVLHKHKDLAKKKQEEI